MEFESIENSFALEGNGAICTLRPVCTKDDDEVLFGPMPRRPPLAPLCAAAAQGVPQRPTRHSWCWPTRAISSARRAAPATCCGGPAADNSKNQHALPADARRRPPASARRPSYLLY